MNRHEHIDRFTDEQWEYYSERSAIREICGDEERDVADFMAYIETCEKFDLKPTETAQCFFLF